MKRIVVLIETSNAICTGKILGANLKDALMKPTITGIIPVVLVIAGLALPRVAQGQGGSWPNRRCFKDTEFSICTGTDYGNPPHCPSGECFYVEVDSRMYKCQVVLSYTCWYHENAEEHEVRVWSGGVCKTSNYIYCECSEPWPMGQPDVEVSTQECST